MSHLLHKWCRVKSGVNNTRAVFVVCELGDRVSVEVPKSHQPLTGSFGEDVWQTYEPAGNLSTMIVMNDYLKYRLAAGELSSWEMLDIFDGTLPKDERDMVIDQLKDENSQLRARSSS